MSEKRIVVTRPMLGLAHMQVCAESDATDEEILAVCNQENPSGTTLGWARVIRLASDLSEHFGPDERGLPVPCATIPGRVHFLVVC